MSSIFTELKRRNVIRVALLYGLAAWIILQVAGLLFGLLELPNWAGKLVLGLLLLGFPLVLLFSWIYELTPDGIRRESQIDRSEAAAGPGVRKLNIAIVALLVLTIAIVAIDRLLPDGRRFPRRKPQRIPHRYHRRLQAARRRPPPRDRASPCCRSWT